MDDHNNYVSWKSRWTFIMAATGSAVGLGNIWKFPYITGEYGGGAFVMFYLICILAVGVPVMIAEIMLGRRARTDPIDGMMKVARESGRSANWGVVGIVGVLAGMMILMFYSVVAGWALDYIYQSITGAYAGANHLAIKNDFGALTNNAPRQLLWHTLFIFMTGVVVAGGVTRGIGTAVETMMPLLFLLLLILLGYSLATGDFAGGMHFLFYFDPSKLTADGMLVGLGHAFFTLSLGMGAIMAYGSYMPASGSVAKTVVAVAFLDTLIALMAGMTIFPLIFANHMTPEQGPGLLFVSLPIAFASMPGGQLVGTIFFVLVTIAALSSSISLIEPGVAWLEKQGVRRIWGTVMLGGAGWLGGIACINHHAVFDMLDAATTNIMLPTGGLLIAVFTGWRMRRAIVREEIDDLPPWLFNLWYAVTRLVAPAGIALVFLNSIGVL